MTLVLIDDDLALSRFKDEILRSDVALLYQDLATFKLHFLHTVDNFLNCRWIKVLSQKLFLEGILYLKSILFRLLIGGSGCLL